jgi:predicted metal-dependent enzyme (double-stranded beta helix superfamily)
MSGIARLRRFITGMTDLVTEEGHDEARLLTTGRKMLGELVAVDDWLPEFCAVPHPDHYCQYLLHCDPLERFSVVSFVWGPGQGTPIHDHTVWGLIGMLRGAEVAQRYTLGAPGTAPEPGHIDRLEPGLVEAVSPTIGDIHQVRNAHADRPSISIHVYGANIGAVHRHVFDAATGVSKDFVSGYNSDRLPNPWGGARQ